MTRVQTACRANPIIRDLARRTTLSDGLVTRVQTACRANPIILGCFLAKSVPACFDYGQQTTLTSAQHACTWVIA